MPATHTVPFDFAANGFQLVHQGKVRDTYSVPDHPDKLLVVASDRISIFDFVLGSTIPDKGAVLTAMTHFWLTNVLDRVMPNHLVPGEHNPTFNMAYELSATYPRLPLDRCLVVRKLDMLPYELIFRRHPGGSVWNEYLNNGTIAGQVFPPGMKRWEQLPSVIFCPSTKAVGDHDENITVAEFRAQTSEHEWEIVHRLKTVFDAAYEHALEQGLVLLDSKFEVGRDGTLADEVLTPDSSRFTTRTSWEQAMAKEGDADPVFEDKQLVRAHGSTVQTPFSDKPGIKQLDPKNPEHVAWAQSYHLPEGIIQATRDAYLRLFHSITGASLPGYQVEFLGVAA